MKSKNIYVGDRFLSQSSTDAPEDWYVIEVTHVNSARKEFDFKIIKSHGYFVRYDGETNTWPISMCKQLQAYENNIWIKLERMLERDAIQA